MPAARPLFSSDTEPSAIATRAGLKRPVPKQATSTPGSSAVQLELGPGIRIRPSPTVTSIRPVTTMTEAGTFFTSSALAPETRKTIIDTKKP